MELLKVMTLKYVCYKIFHENSTTFWKIITFISWCHRRQPSLPTYLSRRRRHSVVSTITRYHYLNWAVSPHYSWREKYCQVTFQHASFDFPLSTTLGILQSPKSHFFFFLKERGGPSLNNFFSPSLFHGSNSGGQRLLGVGEEDLRRKHYYIYLQIKKKSIINFLL